MIFTKRKTDAEARIVATIKADPQKLWHLADLWHETSMRLGRVGPALTRLVWRGVLISYWDVDHGPYRRVYQLTAVAPAPTAPEDGSYWPPAQREACRE